MYGNSVLVDCGFFHNVAKSQITKNLPTRVTINSCVSWHRFSLLIINHTSNPFRQNRCLINGRQFSSKARYRIPYSTDPSTSNWRDFVAVYLLARHTKSHHSQENQRPWSKTMALHRQYSRRQKIQRCSSPFVRLHSEVRQGLRFHLGRQTLCCYRRSWHA